jgi:predicted small integral membrane protein
MIMLNSRLYLLRISQILLVFVCFLREAVNFITDIGQYHHNLPFFYKIIHFPTQEHAHILFDRSIHSHIIGSIAPIILVGFHGLVAAILAFGIVVLLKNIRASDYALFREKKFLCILGLALGVFQYFFFYAFLCMDYFLSWMQGVNYNMDFIGYSWPLAFALIYLLLTDFESK